MATTLVSHPAQNMVQSPRPFKKRRLHNSSNDQENIPPLPFQAPNATIKPTLQPSQDHIDASTLSIEDLNALPIETYTSLLFPTPPALLSQPSISIGIETASSLTQAGLNACFHLIEESSKDDYASSSLGWNPRAKRKEMRLLDMRYLLLRASPRQEHASPPRSPTCNPTRDIGDRASGEAKTHLQSSRKVHEDAKSGTILGFASTMFTYEDDYPLLYLYEIHLSPSLRGQGVGGQVMRMVEEAARKGGVEKVMLTVFTKNQGASRFYEGLGYEVDEYSPRGRKVRGRWVDTEYVILSKRVRMGLRGGVKTRKKKRTVDG